ncbi:hypothetical protein KC906_04740 [Candidatus Kaiserbacteria bacterium]|nr:hypothetical protein [Candidatus Kaiserbacteria bacterium]MCB9812354.1 hypothetical protein [Candidatus Nomurabacteria bacterium]
MAKTETVLQQRSPAFIRSIGVEQEGFAPGISCADVEPVPGGFFIDDAGHHLWELVTHVQTSVSAAIAVLKEMSARYPDIDFTPFRPASLQGAADQWHEKARYRCILEALRRESSEWHVVHQMTNQAALQVNVGGDFDPFGDEGAFLINVFNDLAPFVAAMIHHELGSGKGHLQIWQRFARAERLPAAGRWFLSGSDMVRYIESTPKLIKETAPNSNVYVPLPGEMQRIDCRLDLGLIWWFARAKVSEHGSYLEIRLMPSMPLVAAEQYANLMVRMVEFLLEWFHGSNRGQPVSDRHQAWDAYLELGQRCSGYIPNRPLTAEVWRELLLR